ncbi:MAG: TIGR03960 family B12-binding radical SAM protein [Deltaproteobacteria bacterium]|nr:TIGR03960 family B12-binding radical SAM protein [Deltaproteobacteria bacterium]
MNIHEQLNTILRSVQKPGQYLGNEANAIHKDNAKADLRVALIFPDAYEMGMSHVGLKILYALLNSLDGVVAERCFAPLPDMEAKLRENNIPLFSLESKTPLKDFDLIGFSLPYELTYTNVLNILDLAQIPLFQKDRDHRHPFILGGGTQSYNPEPMADFFDAIAIGDGEELILDVASTLVAWKKDHNIDWVSQNQNPNTRADLTDRLTKVEGVYVPRFFEPVYKEDGTLKEVKALKEGYTGIKKRILKDLNTVPYPTKWVVPNIRLIHDRIGIEIQRGCTRMCRFCQAGYVERPTRQRDPQKVLEIADQSIKETGIEELSLLSLSAGDYQTIVPTLKELNHRYQDKKISISVPATRTETLTPELIEQVKKVRMTGFTIAPEAGSERMRRVINKGNKVENLMQACRNAFSQGYRLIKFYYMCGLPFETDQDVANIAEEAFQALKVGYEHTRDVQINVSVSSFVPKPFTPFQWEPQMSIEETKRRHHLVKSNLKSKKLKFKHHNAQMSFLEGLFARGDRRLSQVIYQAFKNGCRFDEWTEHFRFDLWEQSIAETNTNTDFYLHRRREKDEVLPWDHLFTQMRKEWLWNEYQNAAHEAHQEDCAIDKCAQFCGVCDFKSVQNKVFVVDDKEIAAKKGNRLWQGRFGESDTKHQEQKQAKANPSSSPAKTNDNTTRFRLRVHYSKTGYATLLSHLELMGLLKRALLKNEFPVCFSIGFHPQMKLAMGYALSLGVESLAEHFDLSMANHVEIDDFITKMNKSVPQGVKIISAEYIDLKAPSLYSDTVEADYEITLPQSLDLESLEKFDQNLNDLKNGKEFVYERAGRKNKKSRSIEINKLIVKDKLAKTSQRQVRFSLVMDKQGSVKPAEVIAALADNKNIDLTELKVKKVGIAWAN